MALQCLDKHPTQPHIVCTGGQDGALTVWDMRQDRFPVTVLNAHSADSKYWVYLVWKQLVNQPWYTKINLIGLIKKCR